MFENRYVTSDELEREFVERVLAQKIQAQAKFVLVIAVVFLAFSIIMRNVMFVLLYLGVTAFAMYSMKKAPLNIFNSLKASYMKRNNNQMVETVTEFTEDKIILSEGNNKAEFTYSQMTRLVDIPSSVVLMVGKNNGLLLKKDAFGEKTLDEFLVFINEKCPQLKKAEEEEKNAGKKKSRKSKNEKSSQEAVTVKEEEIKEEVKEEPKEETKE